MQVLRQFGRIKLTAILLPILADLLQVALLDFILVHSYSRKLSILRETHTITEAALFCKQAKGAHSSGKLGTGLQENDNLISRIVDE